MSPLSLARAGRRALIGTVIVAALAVPVLPRESHIARAETAMPSMTLMTSTMTFPKTVSGGLLQVKVVNNGKALAEARFGRAPMGSTQQQFAALIHPHSQQGFVQLLTKITWVGGADALPAGQSATLTLNLATPGLYVVINGFGSKPISSMFTVTAAPTSQASEPAANVTVSLQDMTITGLPSQLAAGTVTFKVTSVGPSVHQMLLIQLGSGKTISDFLAALKTGKEPAWAHVTNGMDLISPHQTAWLTIALTPGNYAAACFVSDPKKGFISHAMEGMITALTVS